MPLYLDTRGRSTLGIGICARCSVKMPLGELLPDPNAPGLLVCREDRDQYDPWRLPPPRPDRITLDNPRPDVTLTPGTRAVPVLPIQATMRSNPTNTLTTIFGWPPIGVAPPVTEEGQDGWPTAWEADREYALGYQITVADMDPLTSGFTEAFVYTCIVPGTSGLLAPTWSKSPGVLIHDYQVIWINGGLLLP